ncbi:hypothetical protein M3152_05565 [Sporosarcina luteola]|uniref:hypothetical protein n=1 Tax=Bacillales TaxID=1385 RepID=UPI00203C484D|nr:MULTISPECIES: hypothetical protein [Bacillales]MCM3637185.1 hypothetical protein [Sporosarcina luteola]
MIGAESGDSCESRDEERLLRAQAKRCEQDVEAALISAKNAEIRQTGLFVVRLAEAVPAESVRSQRKSTLLAYLYKRNKTVGKH